MVTKVGIFVQNELNLRTLRKTITKLDGGREKKEARGGGGLDGTDRQMGLFASVLTQLGVVDLSQH